MPLINTKIQMAEIANGSKIFYEKFSTKAENSFGKRKMRSVPFFFISSMRLSH